MAAAVATVLGGLHANYGGTLTLVQSTGSQRRVAAQALATKGMAAIRKKMTVLDGVVAGSNATKTNTVVEANVELGGARAITTETLVNATTVAGDVTEIENDIHQFHEIRTFGASPVANLDGNPLGTR